MKMDVQTQQTITAQSTEENPRKMFIGGLSWQTTAESLQDYFKKFGEIKECLVMKDPITKRSRGFGFVTFMDLASVDKVINQVPHILDAKKIDPKVAVPKKGTKDGVTNGLCTSGLVGPEMVTKTKKVFVGGVSTTTEEDDIKRYFEKFGKVTECLLMFDRNTKRNRGFAFVTFEDEDCAASACRIHFHDLNGRMVEAKMAQPKEVMNAVNATKSDSFSDFASFVPNFFPPGFQAYATYSRPFPYPVHYIPGFSGYTGATYMPGNDSRQTVNSPAARGSGSGVRPRGQSRYHGHISEHGQHQLRTGHQPPTNRIHTQSQCQRRANTPDLSKWRLPLNRFPLNKPRTSGTTSQTI